MNYWLRASSMSSDGIQTVRNKVRTYTFQWQPQHTIERHSLTREGFLQEPEAKVTAELRRRDLILRDFKAMRERGREHQLMAEIEVNLGQSKADVSGRSQFDNGSAA
jgi:hypothetical protein